MERKPHVQPGREIEASQAEWITASVTLIACSIWGGLRWEGEEEIRVGATTKWNDWMTFCLFPTQIYI